ncbi:hypothetical protein B0H12DRAFT_608168 [Mycena haematopus]|nr:hypothetical protein B0H12DRAFT_608168 [Mycena haematopus]
MANPQPSPISQLLNSLGITREDLERRSDQMREFLTADSAISARVSRQLSSSSAQSRSLPRASSSTAPFTRHISRGVSISARDASPTPAPTVKPEPEEESLPPRQFDSMEMVLERQRLNRKQKRSRKREPDLPNWTALPPGNSPPPNDASNSGAGPVRPAIPREDHRAMAASSSSSTLDPSPVTPMRSKYYREHTSYPDSDAPVIKAESPSPSVVNSAPASTYPYPYFYYSAYAAQNQFLTLPFRSAQASSSSSFKTPVKESRSQRNQHSPPSHAKSPLPPSSPPDASSPASSPAVRLVNIVSSPGAIDELADEPKAPPYTLPPGPYSDQRPHHSYAALIGQAVLSSENHRLTLQEIYEWIATVYPHFKRGERTWMNSIRHVLSTTVHFRKISRERSAGRSHWAIFDEDLHCFVDGGYRKPGTMLKRVVARPKSKKRAAEEEEDTSPSTLAKKSAKRPKKTTTNHTLPIPALPTSLFPVSSEQPPGLLPALVHPQEKPRAPTGPATHHQTYYESCVSAPGPFAPSEIIFPPLPNTSYRLVASNISSVATPAAHRVDECDVESEEECDYLEPPSTQDVQPSSPMAPVSTSGRTPQSTPARPSSTSPTSVPALTPNCSSSSPILTGEMDQESDAPEARNVSKDQDELPHLNASITIAGVDDTTFEVEEQQKEESVFGPSLLRPVQFWDEPSQAADDTEALQPGIELQESAIQDESDDDDDDDVPLMLISQTNKLMKKDEKATTVKIKVVRPLVKMPAAPILQRRKTATAARAGNKNGKRKKLKPSKAPVASPATPPRDNNRRKIQLSPMHTPLSHKGLYMSPSATLTHYKSRLDPPPTLVYGTASSSRLSPQREDDDYEPSDAFRTPARKRNAASSSAHPITPKRLLFGIDGSSPFRTPGGGTLSASPFRTPGGSRGGGIFDPHDPSTLLDEELSSLGAAGRDSPAGLYGKGTLYDSPNPLDGSPGKWARWW